MAEDQFQESLHSQPVMTQTNHPEDVSSTNVETLKKQLQEAHQKIEQLKKICKQEYLMKTVKIRKLTACKYESQRTFRQVVINHNSYFQSFSQIVDASYADQDDIEVGKKIAPRDFAPITKSAMISLMKKTLAPINKRQDNVDKELREIKQMVERHLNKEDPTNSTDMTSKKINCQELFRNVILKAQRNNKDSNNVGPSGSGVQVNKINKASNGVEIQAESFTSQSTQNNGKDLDKNNKPENEMLNIAKRITKHSLQIPNPLDHKPKFEGTGPSLHGTGAKSLIKTSKQFREEKIANSKRLAKAKAKLARQAFLEHYHVVPPLVKMKVGKLDRKVVLPLRLQKTKMGTPGVISSLSSSSKSPAEKQKPTKPRKKR